MFRLTRTNTGSLRSHSLPRPSRAVFGLAMAHHIVTMINMLFYFRGSGKWGVEGYEFCEKFHNVQSFIFKQAITWTVIYTGRESSS